MAALRARSHVAELKSFGSDDRRKEVKIAKSFMQSEPTNPWKSWDSVASLPRASRVALETN